MTRWPALAAAITALALVGCGADPAVPDQLAPPATPPAATAAAEPPATATPATADPAATPPEAPAPEAPAPEHGGAISSAADARAVEQLVRDYYAAINRAQYEGDVAGLEALSTPDCNCRAIPEMLHDVLALGRVQGGLWSLNSVQVQRVGDGTASALAHLAIADGTIVDAAGQEVGSLDNLGGGTTTVAMLETKDGWRVAQTRR